MYVDSGLENNKLLSGSINTNTANLIIGKDINGYIDDAMIFNRALSASEIQSIYNSQVGFIP